MANLGHYELVREIGAGGMSTVYEATDTRIGRRVALKVLTLPPYISQAQRLELVQRLRREARAAGRLNHPNIVTLYDFGEADGHHFLAMEYLNGPTLRDRLREGPLTPLEASHVLDGLASALDAAHAEGILHRDIKPGNVILLPDGRVKLADFGVARQLDDATLTQAGSPVGSPAYMAPEQVRGEPASPASDRWALGIVLYEMLAGKPPFTGENVPAVLHQVAYDPAPPLSGGTPQIQAVLGRALSKEPTDRWRSSHELAAAFRAAVPHAPGQAESPAVQRLRGAERRQTSAAGRSVAGVKGGEAAAPPPVALPRAGRPWIRLLPLAIAAAAVLLVSYPAVVNHARHPTRHRITKRQPAPSASSPRPAPRAIQEPTTRVVVTELTPHPAPHAASPRPPASTSPRRHTRTVRPHLTKHVHAAPQAGRLASQRSAPRRLANRSADIGLPTTLAKPKTRRPRHAPVRGGAQETSGRERGVLSAVRPTRAGGTAAALNARAYRLQKAGRHVEAEPLLREAVRRDPSRAYAQYNLGWSLLSQGKAREALGPLRRTAAQQPERWEPQLRLGQAYAQLGESEKARSAFARARSLQARSAHRGRHTIRRAGSRRRSGPGAEGRISARHDKGQTLTGGPTPVQ